MSYVVDLVDGRLYFIKLEEEEYIRIHSDEGHFVVDIFSESRNEFPDLVHSYKNVRQFCVMGDD